MTLAPALLPRAAERALCLHCRTALPLGTPGEFCCKGCESVHALLASAGLDRYYVLRGERTLAPVAASARGHEQPWLEALALELSSASGLHRFALDVQGIQCGACVWLIEALFKRQPEAHQAQVNPALGQVRCVVGPSFPLRDFVTTVESFGYTLGPAKKSSSRETSSLMLRTGVCLALAVNTMLLSATTYFGLEQGPLFDLVNHASFALATLSALIGGSYFVRRAVLGLSRGVLHLDLPIAIGMGLAYLGSVLSLFFGGASASYLDTVSVFIALMLVGRLLQERLVEKNRQILLANDGASGLIARRLVEGRSELVPCARLATGDQLLICPGEIVPVRARLVDERATVTLDWINGESEPRHFVEGDALVAGAINAGERAFGVVALAAFERSDLDALLCSEQGEKSGLRGDFWDRLSRIYVLLVLAATALVVGLGWLRGESLVALLDVATAVLVVTCPCAFGIASPLAYELAVAGLRRAGLFVRDASFFDRAARVQRIVFDKTGTLTTGALALRDESALSALTQAQRALLYDLSAQSNHPKSAAIARALSAADPTLRLGAARPRESAGLGMELTCDGISYRLGEPEWALGRPSDLRGPLFTADGQLLAVLESAEVARPDASQEAAALARDGYELWVASGDTSERAQAMAETLRIPTPRALGDLTPDDKRALVERIGARETLMLGDGINDGPALSAALCAGTPAIDRPFVPARTDFYFLTAGLSPVRLALRSAKSVRRVVRHALAFATLYNVFAVTLAYLGLMRPWLAAVLMPASSLLVLAYTVLALSPRSSLWKS